MEKSSTEQLLTLNEFVKTVQDETFADNVNADSMIDDLVTDSLEYMSLLSALDVKFKVMNPRNNGRVHLSTVKELYEWYSKR